MDERGMAGNHGRHTALIYRDSSEYAAAVSSFVQAGLARDEPVFVAVPQAQFPVFRQPAFSQPLDDTPVSLADMEELGRNPARIISAVRAFADRYPGRSIRFLGESLWPSRSLAEREETARHEALLNLAFAADGVTIMCPYNAAALPASAISAAYDSHPLVLSGGEERHSPDFAASGELPAWLDVALPDPPADTQELGYQHDLRPVRALVAAAADSAGLSAVRKTDLVIAASEVAANTLRHTTGGGVVRLWRTAVEIICQIDDSGFIADPLAGRFKPGKDQAGGHGLWLVNQVCDLVQIRTSKLGTTVRLHMRRR